MLIYKGRLITSSFTRFNFPPCWVIKSFWAPPSESGSCGSSVTGKRSPNIHSYHFYGHSHLGFSFLWPLESRVLQLVISSAFHLPPLGGRPFLRSLHFCAAAGKHTVLIVPGCKMQSRHQDIRGPTRGERMDAVVLHKPRLLSWLDDATHLSFPVKLLKSGLDSTLHPAHLSDVQRYRCIKPLKTWFSPHFTSLDFLSIECLGDVFWVRTLPKMNKRARGDSLMRFQIYI